MFGSSLAPAASVLFALSFSATSTLPPITPSEMPLSQTTSAASVTSAKSQSQSAGESSPSAPPASAAQASPAAQDSDPLKRALPAKKKKFGKLSRAESAYKNWADQEVQWIITEEEREAFKLLSNDEEREKLIEDFWGRRDPSPDTVENESRDEYYRRVMYANERFSAGIPGSKTDRGRTYILYGPPDEIESHPSGGTAGAPPFAFFERWDSTTLCLGLELAGREPINLPNLS